ncbi:MAG: hypothetical protein ACREFQ_17435, partial [Stellaceae bacterium]
IALTLDDPEEVLRYDAARERTRELGDALALLKHEEAAAFGHYGKAINRVRDAGRAVLAAKATKLGRELGDTVARALDLADRLSALDACNFGAAVNGVPFDAATMKARQAAWPLTAQRFPKMHDAAIQARKPAWQALFAELTGETVPASTPEPDVVREARARVGA